MSNKEYQRQWYRKNRENVLKRMAARRKEPSTIERIKKNAFDYYRKPGIKEKIAIYGRARYKEHREEILSRQRSYRAQHKREAASHERELSRRLRKELLAAYGNHCACCRESRVEFLTIDHIFGGGKKDRRKYGRQSTFYKRIKNEGYPKDRYRLLCMNCNWSLGHYGYCPHGLKSSVPAHNRYQVV